MSKAIQRMRANLAVGLNCPVSIELIVFRETPTISASWDCESFFSNRASFNLFCNFNSSFIPLPQWAAKQKRRSRGSALQNARRWSLSLFSLRLIAKISSFFIGYLAAKFCCQDYKCAKFSCQYILLRFFADALKVPNLTYRGDVHLYGRCTFEKEKWSTIGTNWACMNML